MHPSNFIVPLRGRVMVARPVKRARTGRQVPGVLIGGWPFLVSLVLVLHLQQCCASGRYFPPSPSGWFLPFITLIFRRSSRREVSNEDDQRTRRTPLFCFWSVSFLALHIEQAWKASLTITNYPSPPSSRLFHCL